MATKIEPKPTADDAIAKDRLIAEDTPQLAKGERLPRPKGVNEKSRILWPYLIVVITLHLLLPLAFVSYFFSWWGMLWLPIGNYLFTSLGIGAGYHRLLTHRGFKCPKWFEYTLAVMGVCSLQDSPCRWVLVHRVHHQHSDHQSDPHTPKVSAFWAHVGWMFIDNQELSTAGAYDKYVRDLMRDPFYLWLQRGINWIWVYVVHALAIWGLGFLVGYLAYGTSEQTIQMGMRFLIWGVILRTIFTWHVTWGINSFSHMWGYKNYDTREDSRNNWLFALLTNGEGWHNNHHADPRSARHGHRWWEIDITWMSLRFFEKIGIIRDLVPPNQSALEKKSV